MAVKEALERTEMSPSVNEQGFTLMELLVVLAVMALVSVLLVPLLGRATSGAVSAPARVIVRDLERLRLEAVKTGEVRRYNLSNATVPLQWIAGHPSGSLAPSFYPDGSAAGGTLRLSAQTSININWADGHANLRR